MNLNFGAQTMPLSSSGFTFLATLRFRRSPQNNERIFDFGSGVSPNNIAVGRQTTSANLNIVVFGIQYITNVAASPFSSTQDAIMNLAVTYDQSALPYTLRVWSEGINVCVAAYSTLITARSVTSSFVGRSIVNTDGCTNMDVFSLKTFNRVLSPDEIQGLAFNPLRPPIISVSRTSATRLILNGNTATATTRGWRFQGGRISNDCSFLNFGSEMLGLKTSGFAATMVLELPMSRSGGSVETLFEFADAFAGTSLYLHRNKLSNTFIFGYNRVNSISDSVSFTVPYQQADVYGIAVQYSAGAGVTGSLSIWFNGTVVRSKTSAVALDQLVFTHSVFGSSLNVSGISTDCFTGLLTSYRVYERTLSSLEITNDLNQSSVICPAGRFMNDTTAACQQCPIGTFKPQAANGQEYCLLCPPNTTCSTFGATIFQCNPGLTLNSSTQICIRCPLGTFKSTVGNDDCTACPANAVCTDAKQFSCNPGYTISLAGDGCVQCEAGTYKSAPGNGECTTCPPNSDCFFYVGATSFQCVQGYTIDQYSSNCLTCGDNTYKDQVGNQPCQPCVANAFCTGSAYQCMPGFYLDMNTFHCVPCADNQYKELIGNEPCEFCPLNHVCNSTTVLGCINGTITYTTGKCIVPTKTTEMKSIHPTFTTEVSRPTPSAAQSFFDVILSSTLYMGLFFGGCGFVLVFLIVSFIFCFRRHQQSSDKKGAPQNSTFDTPFDGSALARAMMGLNNQSSFMSTGYSIGRHSVLPSDKGKMMSTNICHRPIGSTNDQCSSNVIGSSTIVQRTAVPGNNGFAGNYTINRSFINGPKSNLFSGEYTRNVDQRDD